MNIVSTQDILKDFLKSREFDNYSTYLTIKSCIKKWGKKLPNNPNEISRADVKFWISNMRIDRKTVRQPFYVMKMAFDIALENNKISNNPFSNIKVNRENSTNIDAFSLCEVKKILENSNGILKTYLMIAFNTGARPGEILALKWEDINFEKKEIYITKSLSNGFISPTTKTKTNRIVPIFNNLFYYLKEVNEFSDWIFHNKKGNHLFGSPSLRRSWIKLLKDCKIRYRPIRQTRHTFATFIINKALKENSDIEPIWVSKILGHSGLKITLDTYVRTFNSHLNIDRSLLIYF